VIASVKRGNQCTTLREKACLQAIINGRGIDDGDRDDRWSAKTRTIQSRIDLLVDGFIDGSADNRSGCSCDGDCS
jgi:hypothetical protein